VSTAIFLRLLRDEDKARTLAEAISALQEGRKPESVVYPVSPASFRQVPGSPFAYWVSERIRRLFTELPAFESDGRAVRVGLQTSDDFRFVRAWWEVSSECILDGANGPDWRQDLTAFQAWCRQRTFEGKRWVPLAKGGAYSPYYTDLQLVVNWGQDGQEMKAWADPLYGNSGWSRIIKSVDFYFRPGLTWPLRGIRLSAQAVPSGSIFSVAGKLATSNRLKELSTILALMNSKVFDFLVGVFAGKVGGVQYEVGLIGRIPLPNGFDEQSLEEKATGAYEASVSQGSSDERNHFFFLPALLQVLGDTLAERLAAWRISVAKIEEQLDEYQLEIDGVPFRLYGIDDDDRRAIENSFSGQRSETSNEEPDTDPAGEGAETEPIAGERRLVADLLAYAGGCVFGRWDVRFATGERQPPKLPNPFAPLPVCSTGMLTGEDGLPLREAPPGYPLRIDQDGILVDDPDNPDDIVRRVREVLEVLWQDRAEAIEREACEILGVRELRDYFRKPGKGGCWDDHVSLYSKSRRKAPIYWLLQSSKKNYDLWIYYHRFDKDMLFKALLNYVEPKIRLEESRLEPLRAQRTAEGTSGNGVKKIEKEIDRQEEFISELRDFEDKLRRVANLHLDPDPNDGVVLNIAPLRELVPWKEAKKYWDELRDGEYEWSSIGKQLRQKGIARSP
jgi:hypothetical protein